MPPCIPIIPVAQVKWLQKSDYVWELPAVVKIVIYRVDTGEEHQWMMNCYELDLRHEFVGSELHIAKRVAYARVVMHLEHTFKTLKNTRPYD